MKLLLDTHIWLWSLLDPRKLASRVARALRDEANEVWLSPVSVWEVVILAEKGRIAFEGGAAAWIEEALRRRPMREAPLTHEVALEVSKVLLPHRDPADRFLAATARVFELTLATADERLIKAAGIRTLANR